MDAQEITPLKWSWKPVELPAETAEELGLRFQAGLYESAIRNTRWTQASHTEIELLVSLGNIYSRLDLFREGLLVDKRLVELCPNEPKFHYNLACSHSLLGEIDQAFEALSEAVSLGYDNLPFLRQDRDLTNLKCDDRFDELLQHLESSRESS